jgi:hypothetical protein
MNHDDMSTGPCGGSTVLTLTSGLGRLRPYYTDDTRELFGVLLNSTSAAEANIALEVLKESVPEKPLVTACNLREVIKELPASPFTMHVDEDTLCKAARLDKRMAALTKTLPGGIELVATTAGNLVLDLIVRHEGRKYFWTPVPVAEDHMNPDLLDLVVSDGYLIDQVIDLVQCMGVVFNPTFYLSLADFRMENAASVFEGMGELFGPDPSAKPAHPVTDYWSDPRSFFGLRP